MNSSMQADSGAPNRGDRVFWQAHRGGGAREAPENTMVAFHYAWALGGIPEADLRTTKDSVIFCLHDNTPARTTTAPEEFAGTDVSGLLFSDIRSWDAGSKFDAKFAGERIPAIEEAFLEMEGRPDRMLYLDIKDINIDVLGRLIDTYSLWKQIIFASPLQDECKVLAGMHEELRSMLWIGGPVQDIKEAFARVVGSGFSGVDQVQFHLHDNDGGGAFRYELEPEFLVEALRLCRDSGIDLELFPFAFDEASIHELLGIGIRWFATDEPKRFSEALKTR